MIKCLDFMKNADNVHRTDSSIVKQTIHLSIEPTGDSAIIARMFFAPERN